MLRKTVYALALCGAASLLLGVRTLWSAHDELERAHRVSGKERVDHLRAAAEFYNPFGGACRQALDELRDIGFSHDAEALLAWRSIRSAILSARSLYTPEKPRLAEANRQIALRTSTSAAEQAQLLAVLENTKQPSALWSVVALLGLGGLAASMGAFFKFAIDDEDRVIGGRAFYCGLALALSLTLLYCGLKWA